MKECIVIIQKKLHLTRERSQSEEYLFVVKIDCNQQPHSCRHATPKQQPSMTRVIHFIIKGKVISKDLVSEIN